MIFIASSRRSHFQLKHISRYLIISLFLVLIIMACFRNPAQRKFDQILTDYQNYVQHSDLLYLSQNSRDEMLPNISHSTFKRIIEQTENYQRQLLSCDTLKLKTRRKIEYALIKRHTGRVLFDLKESAVWRKDPGYYCDILGNSLFWPIHFHPEAPNKKAEIIKARLKQVPLFIQQAKENLSECTLSQVKIALEKNKGLENYIRYDLSEQVKSFAQFDDSMTINIQLALNEVEDWQAYLKRQILPLAPDDLPLNKNQFHQLIKVNFDKTFDLAEFLKLIDLELLHIKTDMEKTAAEVYRKYYSRRRYYGCDEVRKTKILQAALEYVRNKRVTPDKIIPSIQSIMNKSERFLTLKQLIQVNKKYELKLINMPDYCGGFPITGLLENQTGAVSFFLLLKTTDARWKWPTELSFTKYFNESMLKVFSLSMLLPGHYLHASFSDTVSGPRQRIFANITTREGWKLYAPYFMRKNGFTGYDPAFILMQQLYHLQAVQQARLSILLYTNELNPKSVQNILNREAYLSDPIQNWCWEQIVRQPELVIARFWGFYQIRELYRDFRRLRKNRFDLDEFNTQLMNSGFISIQTIRHQLMAR